MVPIRDDKGAGIEAELCTEIQVLEKQYRVIKNYLSGTSTTANITHILIEFRNTLNRVSAHILTLYTLKGQKAKITWDSLLTNVGNALETIQTYPRQDPRATIELSLKISDPKIEQVMSYLSTLKESL